MEREQFTFFSSFAKAAKRIRKAADRCAFYDAVVDYALLGVCPDLDSLPDAVALAIELIKPTLDASRRKAENGLLGGKSKANAKQTESKTEANAKREQTASEKEGEIEGEKEKEIENECYSTPTPPLGEVMAFFMNNINAMPSPDVCDLLRQYTETLSAQVVIHAMQITQNERKGWSYLKAILARYEREGLTTIEAVKAQEQAREAGTPKRKYVTASDYAAAPPKPVDMESLRGIIDKI